MLNADKLKEWDEACEKAPIFFIVVNFIQNRLASERTNRRAFLTVCHTCMHVVMMVDMSERANGLFFNCNHTQPQCAQSQCLIVYICRACIRTHGALLGR